jgi:hypothetical protein
MNNFLSRNKLALARGHDLIDAVHRCKAAADYPADLTGELVALAASGRGGARRKHRQYLRYCTLDISINDGLLHASTRIVERSE